MHRRKLLYAATAAGITTILPVARAQDKLIRIVVPYAAGGQTDMMARALAASMSKSLERNVIVENKAGAAALIGTRAVQMAPPDGNTLLFHNSGFVALPMLTKGANYDPVKDFMPVAVVGNGPNYLMVSGTVQARSAAEFIAWAKAQPEGITCANSGLGSAGHLSAQLFAKRAGINITHIPYKGSAETAIALINGEVTMQLTSPTEILTQQAKLGKVRFLAVTSVARTSMAPELPVLSDTIPGFVNDGWFGLLTSAGSPSAQVQAVSGAIKKAVAEPEIRERFLRTYIEPKYLDPSQFASAVDDSVKFWRSVITELNLQQT
jgi:tripartite-type tricarboxylate transporter receptor subunit TctC